MTGAGGCGKASEGGGYTRHSVWELRFPTSGGLWGVHIDLELPACVPLAQHQNSAPTGALGAAGSHRAHADTQAAHPCVTEGPLPSAPSEPPQHGWGGSSAPSGQDAGLGGPPPSPPEELGPSPGIGALLQGREGPEWPVSGRARSTCHRGGRGLHALARVAPGTSGLKHQHPARRWASAGTGAASSVGRGSCGWGEAWHLLTGVYWDFVGPWAPPT